MSTKRFLLAVGAAGVLVAGPAPIAHAAQVGAGVCIERHDTPVRSTASGTPWNGRRRPPAGMDREHPNSPIARRLRRRTRS